MDCEEVLATQHGVITRRQAVAAGLSVSALDRRVRAGRWLASGHAGVFVVGGAARSWRQRLCAAVLAGPEGTVASHRSAAALHGLREGVAIEITVPRGAARQRTPLVHQSDVPHGHRVNAGVIP